MIRRFFNQFFKKDASAAKYMIIGTYDTVAQMLFWGKRYPATGAE